MDGQVTRCAQCGAPASTGRFCTSCGSPLPAGGPPPPEPAYDDTATRDRIPPVPAAAPAAPVAPPPLFRDEVYAPVEQAPLGPILPAASPVYAEPVATQHAARRSPGAGLWIGAAAGLVAVLVVGAFLLLSGGGGDDSSSARPPLVPKSHSSSPSSPTTSTSPTSPPTSATTPTAVPTGKPTEVAGLARASAPRHAPPGVDFGGHTVTYVAANMVDGAADTCWRTPGDATGMVLTFHLDQPTRLTKVGLVNGYAKTVFPGGRRFDWYRGDRRVLSVDWIFDDGTTVSQLFSQTPTMQTRDIPPVTTSTVQVRITSVSPPGHGRAARDDTAISEVSLVGATG